MQIGSVPSSYTPALHGAQNAPPPNAPPPSTGRAHGKDHDGDSNGSTSATSDSTNGKQQLNVVA